MPKDKVIHPRYEIESDCMIIKKQNYYQLLDEVSNMKSTIARQESKIRQLEKGR